jgi:hypothetical protein
LFSFDSLACQSSRLVSVYLNLATLAVRPSDLAPGRRVPIGRVANCIAVFAIRSPATEEGGFP